MQHIYNSPFPFSNSEIFTIITLPKASCYLWPSGAERVFWGIIGTLREEQSQLRAQKRPGSLIPVPVFIIFCRHG